MWTSKSLISTLSLEHGVWWAAHSRPLDHMLRMLCYTHSSKSPVLRTNGLSDIDTYYIQRINADLIKSIYSYTLIKSKHIYIHTESSIGSCTRTLRQEWYNQIGLTVPETEAKAWQSIQYRYLDCNQGAADAVCGGVMENRRSFVSGLETHRQERSQLFYHLLEYTIKSTTSKK